MSGARCAIFTEMAVTDERRERLERLNGALQRLAGDSPQGSSSFYRGFAEEIDNSLARDEAERALGALAPFDLLLAGDAAGIDRYAPELARLHRLALIDRDDAHPALDERQLFSWLEERLSRPDAQHGALLVGFPTTSAQAALSEQLLRTLGRAELRCLQLSAEKSDVDPALLDFYRTAGSLHELSLAPEDEDKNLALLSSLLHDLNTPGSS